VTFPGSWGGCRLDRRPSGAAVGDIRSVQCPLIANPLLDGHFQNRPRGHMFVFDLRQTERPRFQ
jgi:hypothetical protein